MISVFYKAIRKVTYLIINPVYNPILKLQFYLNNVKFGKRISANGILNVRVTKRGRLIIGDDFCVNSGNNYNIIGRQQKTTFWIEGKLKIGNSVGISGTAIICNHEIVIGNNVTIGGNTVIYDTDFHSLNPDTRMNKEDDKKNAKFGKVVINDNVFVGAHSTILKGVTIGNNSVIGACSVVTKDIPNNEIWAGNPAVFIKKINE